MNQNNSQGYAGDLTPEEAWQLLEKERGAVLVDVRTQPEWAFVGFPDLSALGKQPELISWQNFPTMAENRNFGEEVTRAVAAPDTPILFLCRSGGRSRAAAIAMTTLGFGRCYNIEDGFEGPPDSERHRGTVAGWKAAGLPWRQQ